MNEGEHPEKIEINGWHFRVKYPVNETPQPRVMLLLHGYQGNENVMWILTKPLSGDYLLIAPRAPIQHSDDQFIWHEITQQWPDIPAYRQLTGQLLTHVDQLLGEQSRIIVKFDVMGFSQGAVMAYALALLHPERINRVAALAGFIPHVWQDQIEMKVVENQSFFIAHGTQDDIIPISKAHQAADLLKEKGGQVTFCEAEIGHKLSATCFNGLGEFFG